MLHLQEVLGGFATQLGIEAGSRRDGSPWSTHMTNIDGWMGSGTLHCTDLIGDHGIGRVGHRLELVYLF